MSKRQYKRGIDRQQGYLLPPSLDELVNADNPVRAIDAYVESLKLDELGFKNANGELSPGQPAFPPEALLKLYLYGYLHRVRSSRRLEAECQRNLEVIWLLGGLRPGYKTIADFRKDNLKAIARVNRDFVLVCKELDLFGGEFVGIDGSFFRGNVSKSRIFTAERLKRALTYLEKDIAHYLEALNQTDQHEGDEQIHRDPALTEKLAVLRERQQKRAEQLKELEGSGEMQIAEVDPDARRLNKGGGTLAGYNVQAAVDAKNRLMVVSEVTQAGNDEKQLAPMSLAAKAELGVDQLGVAADQGYYSGEQINQCEQNGITPYVPEPDKQAQARQQGRYTRDDFCYDAQADTYRCPAGQVLPRCASSLKGGKKIYHYRSSVPGCRACPLKDQCLPKRSSVRSIARWEHADVAERHRARMQQAGAEKMRQRAGLCEHPFGTLKLWCGWSHFLLRGLAKVRAEMSLLMLSYNFKRVLSIVGLAAFQAYCHLRGLKTGPFSV